jgi:hypothetical protein
VTELLWVAASSQARDDEMTIAKSRRVLKPIFSDALIERIPFGG